MKLGKHKRLSIDNNLVLYPVCGTVALDVFIIGWAQRIKILYIKL